jgi:hypothetical protein
MAIEGAAYLYGLAATAIAFIGFSAIVIFIRQTFGANLTPFQLLLMQFLIEHGFVAVFFSLLPLLLALFDIPHDLIWRLCSGVAAFTLTIWWIDYAVRRYPTARSEPHPIFARINMVFAFLSVLALTGNATALAYRPQVGVYAAAISWVLFQGADVFLLSIKAFLHGPKKGCAENAK